MSVFSRTSGFPGLIALLLLVGGCPSEAEVRQEQQLDDQQTMREFNAAERKRLEELRKAGIQAGKTNLAHADVRTFTFQVSDTFGPSNSWTTVPVDATSWRDAEQIVKSGRAGRRIQRQDGTIVQDWQYK